LYGRDAYEKYQNMELDISGEMELEISKDAPRTFPHLCMFQEVSEKIIIL
jgi:hypothetical protein